MRSSIKIRIRNKRFAQAPGACFLSADGLLTLPGVPFAELADEPTRLPARAVMIGRRREIASGNGIADAGSGSDVQHLHDFVPGDRTGVKNGGVIDVQY